MVSVHELTPFIVVTLVHKAYIRLLALFLSKASPIVDGRVEPIR